jgi:ribosomal-protein-alanine N-acetyltransferase
LLRPVSEADTDLVFNLRSHPLVNGPIERIPLTNRAEAVDFIRKLVPDLRNQNLYYWVMINLAEQESMGIICMWNFSADRSKAEVGYELLPQYWGHGYMHEALEAVIHFAFKQAGFSVLEAWANIGNIASVRVLTQVGFFPVEKDALSSMTTLSAFELVNRNPF